MTVHVQRRNHLYRLRRIRGLRQKQLAWLLGYRGTSMISKFEAGTTLPTLPTAMLLQLALGAQMSELYGDLHQQLQALILKRTAKLPAELARSIRGRVLGKD
jgi:DNA-binding XRE family transcriptional regulator